MLKTSLLFLHLAAAVAWIGGMFFAHFCLRPAATSQLAPPQRLPLMSAALGLFLRYLVVAVSLVLLTGGGLLAGIGFRSAPVAWQIMAVLGVVMAAVYIYVYAFAYRQLRAQCEASAWPQAAGTLARIRRLVVFNLSLGVVVLAASVAAR